MVENDCPKCGSKPDPMYSHMWLCGSSRNLIQGGIQETNACLVFQLSAANAEIARLKAIVERMAITKDGVRYGNGSKVYYIDPTGYAQGLDVGLSFRTDSSVPEALYYPYPVYSSREAAQAAAKGEKS